MDVDKGIERAIAAGERNQATLVLIRNWCRHARIKKTGGTGIVEMQTGLPIGHHAMACDNAVAPGIGTWDLAHAAIDFHDRNCLKCTKRDPVGFPNISGLIAERDARRQRSFEERDQFRKVAEEARARRKAERHALRAGLSPSAAGVIDCIEDLDQDQRGDASERLLAMAKLAPDAFTGDVRAYLFALLEAEEGWFVDVGLEVLQQLEADPSRLARSAVRCLTHHRAVALAADILEKNVDTLDASIVSPVLPSLSALAYPERTLVGIEPTVLPGPLRALHKKHPTPVERTLESMLDERDPNKISLAAGAVIVLAERDPAVAMRLARSLAAKLSRAKYLIDERQTGFAGDDEAIIRLEEALAVALRHAPADADVLIGKYLAGAVGDGEKRLYQAYRWALRSHRRWGAQVAPPDECIRVVLKRLMTAMAGQENEEVLQEILQMFSHDFDDHLNVIREEMTAVMGAAVLMDDEVKRFDARPKPPAHEFWRTLEQRNQRHTRTSLQGALLKLAAEGADARPALIKQYLELLENIPEGCDELRGALIQHCHPLFRSPLGLNASLPSLYGALVGASVHTRAAAARVLGELNQHIRNDLPSLVYEAFVSLLFDRYVWVHTNAVKALEHMELPESLKPAARQALGQIITVYHGNHENDELLVDSITLFLDRFATAKEKRGRLGRLFSAILLKVNPDVLVRELRWLRRHLGDTDDFADVVFSTLSHCGLAGYGTEDTLKSLGALPSSSIEKRKSKLADLAIQHFHDFELVANITEVLTSAGAWDEAVRVNDAIYDLMPDTVESRPLKLRAALTRVASRFEQSLAHGNLARVPALSSEWRQIIAEIEEDRKVHAQQRSPFPGFPIED